MYSDHLTLPAPTAGGRAGKLSEPNDGGGPGGGGGGGAPPAPGIGGGGGGGPPPNDAGIGGGGGGGGALLPNDGNGGGGGGGPPVNESCGISLKLEASCSGDSRASVEDVEDLKVKLEAAAVSSSSRLDGLGS